MRTAPKISKSKAKTKAKATSKAGAKAKPRAVAKTKPRALAKTKPRALAKTKPRAAAKPKAAAKPAKGAVKSNGKTAPKAKAGAKIALSPQTNARSVSRARKPPPRRDGGGRLDPKYARDLLALSRESRGDDNERAFVNGPRSGDDLAEELGEEAVETMTSGEDQGGHLSEQVMEEERGGPFVKTGGEEFARGTDRSNPRDATREPFPRT